MRKVVKASRDLQNYTVNVNFATYIGADEEYNVLAENENDALFEALENAKLDLTVEDIDEIDEGEYEVHIGFCGFIGVEEIYTVLADSSEEAGNLALDEAADDLSAEVVDDDYEEE